MDNYNESGYITWQHRKNPDLRGYCCMKLSGEIDALDENTDKTSDISIMPKPIAMAFAYSAMLQNDDVKFEVRDHKPDQPLHWAAEAEKARGAKPKG